jgi:translation initiation factor 3 subunit C
MGLLPPLQEGRRKKDDSEKPHSSSGQASGGAWQTAGSNAGWQSGGGSTVYSSEVKQKAKVIVVETVEELDKKVSELVASRGRKGTDIKDLIKQLEIYGKIARKFGAKREIPILMHIISAMFDSNRSIDDYMDIQQWRSCYRCLNRVVTLLAENPSLVLGVASSEELSDFVLAAQGGKKDAAPTEDKDDNIVRVVGTLEAFIVLLEKEYIKSLQQINPHTQVILL